MAAILLMTPITVGGRIVDSLTGGYGFSHCVLDANEEDMDGTPLWWDCTPKRGIHRVRATDSKYVSRETARIELEPEDSIFIWRCASACEGRRYSTRNSCASWLIRCLPPYLEVFAEAVSERYKLPLSPNTLAIAFGIETPGDVVTLGGTPS